MREAPTTGLGWRPCENADDGWRESLRFALFAVSRHPRSFLVITALVLVSTALILPAPLISKAVVNLVVNGGDPGRIVTLSGLALAAVAFERFVSYWHGVVIFHRFRCLVRDLRRQLLDHLLRVPLPILQRLEPANLSARIANDSQSVLQAFYDDLISVSESCITSLACMTAMLLIEPRLGLLTLAAAPVYFSCCNASAAASAPSPTFITTTAPPTTRCIITCWPRRSSPRCTPTATWWKATPAPANGSSPPATP